jgi:hypothetical protein
LNDHGNQPVIGKFEFEVHGIASPERLDNLTTLHRQHKEMSETAQTNSPSNLRFRQCPVEKIRIRFSDFAPTVSPDHLFAELPGEEFIEIDARSTLSHIVPKISIRELSKERPDLFCPVDEFIKLPPQCLAKAYRLREEAYELGSEFSPHTSTEPFVENLLEATQNLARLAKAQSFPSAPTLLAVSMEEPIPEALPEASPEYDPPRTRSRLCQRPTSAPDRTHS